MRLLPYNHKGTSLSELLPEFSDKCAMVLANCKARGVEMIPFFTTRSPYLQAELYVSSRDLKEVSRQVVMLHNTGAVYLGNLLMYCFNKRTVQAAKHVTQALPGMSWHAYRQALDCYVNEDANKDGIPDPGDWVNPGYEVYAQEAEKLGLTSALRWKTMKEGAHIQMPPTFRTPMNALGTYYNIQAELDKIFERVPGVQG